MSRGSCGATAFTSRFALPDASTAGALVRALGRAGLTVQRARAAARLGDPDPFPLRRLASTAAPDAPVVIEEAAGALLTPDSLDAVLVEQAVVQKTGTRWLAGLFDGAPGPHVRALGLDLAQDHPLAPVLRYPAAPVAQPTLGEPEWLSCEAVGEPAVATVRALATLPDGRLAAGTDYGMAVYDGARWEPFPFPRGARREARRVEAMTSHAGALHVATMKTRFRWQLSTGEVSVHHLPKDDVGGHDDVRSLLSAGQLYAGWRLGLRVDDGPAMEPAEALSLCRDPGGFVWAGTKAGELHIVEHGVVRTFSGDGKGRPIRHLAWAEGSLWVAAAGALHRFDGASWSSRPGEPTHLARGPRGSLWSLEAGRVHVGAPPRAVDLPIDRPWCLGFAYDALWVGAVGGLLRVPLC